MADYKGEPFRDHIKLLTETKPDFPQKLKQRILPELGKVTNHFQFLGGLLVKGVLSDESNDSEGNALLKELMVQHAVMIACSKDARGIGGLMDAMEESGNLALISALRTWCKEEFPIETIADLSQPKKFGSVMQATESKALAEQAKNSIELSSSTFKFIDKIMSIEEKVLMEQIEGHLVDMAPNVVNTQELCSSLAKLNVLDNNGINDMTLKTGPEVSQGEQTEKSLKIACTKQGIVSLVLAFQRSGNEHILDETLEWLETVQTRKKNYPISVKSLAGHRVTEERKAVRPTFFKQAPPSIKLEEVAALSFVPDSFAKGTFRLELDNEKIMAWFDDGTVKLGNWMTNEEKTIKFGGQVQGITAFQYDEEILVLGTAQGTVFLFDVTTLEEQWSLRLGQPVESLKFVDSTLVTFTRDVDYDPSWWIDISRSDMQLSNQRIVTCRANAIKWGFLIDPCYSYFYSQNTIVYIYSTELGQRKTSDDSNQSCWLEAPAEVNTLKCVDLISTKRYVVAGCKNGTVAIWSPDKFVAKQRPVKTLQGHMEAVVSLCDLKGHLLSLDQTGKLLMWSGYDLENKNAFKIVPRVLAANFSSGTDLVAHERWFASSSPDHRIIKIWTLPDLWLRTG